jgi:hypothetical protein
MPYPSIMSPSHLSPLLPQSLYPHPAMSSLDSIHIPHLPITLAKLHQGNRDFIMYYVEFQCLIMDLDWNAMVKHTALHHGLSEELKDILLTSWF